MKFDKLANLVIEGKQKREKFSNLIVGNMTPTFTAEDILRDPTDPSKGTKLYIGGAEAKKKGIDPGSPQAINRQLRRLNWVAKKLIRKHKGKTDGVSLERLTNDIAELLEQYQTKVLGWSKPDKANTGYETRVVGNILLPPTGRTPQGKSVFMAPGMDPNATAASASKPARTKRPRGSGVPGTPAAPRASVSADDILKRFDQVVSRLDVLMDTDLRDVIKGHAADPDSNTVRDVLKDPKVEDQYEPQMVRDTIRGMLKAGVITKDGEGNLTIAPESQSLASKIRSGRGAGIVDVLDADDDLVSDDEIEVPSGIDAEDEENIDQPGDSTSEKPASWVEGDDEDEEEDDEYKSSEEEAEEKEKKSGDDMDEWFE